MSERYEDFTGIAREFEDMDRDQLRAQARKWCLQALCLEDKIRHVLAGTDALMAEDKKRLGKIWDLIDLGKKAVSTDAIREAFGVDLLKAAPCSPTGRGTALNAAQGAGSTPARGTR